MTPTSVVCCCFSASYRQNY